MLLDIRKQFIKCQRINGQTHLNEEERRLLKLEWKIFNPLNPIPLQVLALKSASDLCRKQKAEIREIFPAQVLQMAMMKATAHARDNPSYPLRGVYFHEETSFF